MATQNLVDTYTPASRRHILYPANERLVVVDLHPGSVALPHMATHMPMLQVTGSTTTDISNRTQRPVESGRTPVTAVMHVNTKMFTFSYLLIRLQIKSAVK